LQWQGFWGVGALVSEETKNKNKKNKKKPSQPNDTEVIYEPT
jgi:hypothetical protein